MRKLIAWLGAVLAWSSTGAAWPQAQAVLAPVSEAELAEIQRMLPPPELKLPNEPKTLELEGDGKDLFQQLGKACSLDTVFDRDYQPGPRLRLRVAEVTCRQAIRQLEAATSSFVVPLGERLVLVARDTPQKRVELEPTVAVTIPVPEPVSVQELQELARAVQQAMEISKMGFDSQRRLLVLRDRISKVRPAELLFEQLLKHRGQVSVELELVEVDRSSLLVFGLSWPTEFPFYNFVRVGPVAGTWPAERLAGLLFGGGKTMIGIGIGKAQLLANLTESAGRTLLRTEVHALAGQPASLHVGDQYPIMTAGYFGYTGGLPAFTPPPTTQFADLGLVFKFTAYVHGPDEVTLDLEAEFKLLAGESVNGIPLISNRRAASRVRIRQGEWAVVAGLMSASDTRALRGLAGLARLPLIGPLFGQQTLAREAREVLVVVKPRVLSWPPSESVARELWVGSETRLPVPL